MSDTAKRLIIFYETHLHSTYGVTNASPDSCPPHPCLQGAASGSNLGHFVKSKTGIDIRLKEGESLSWCHKQIIEKSNYSTFFWLKALW